MLKIRNYPYLIIFKSIYLVRKVVSGLYTVLYVYSYSFCILYAKRILLLRRGEGFIQYACLD